MATNYAQHLNTQSTPQNEPLFGRTDQVQNSAGGYVFKITPEQQLTRFLILGAEGGTYYATEKELTKNNANNIIAMLNSNGLRAVDIIRNISVAQPARAPKNDACVFALAVAAVHGNDEVKSHAFSAIADICRIPTDLFAFIDSYQTLGGGWGRRMKRAISEWYTAKAPMDLAYAMTKYQARNGWSHRDVLRLAHIHPQDDVQNQLFHYAVKGEVLGQGENEVAQYLEAVQLSLSGKLDKKDTITLINTFNLPREVIATNMLNERDVWEALLEKMPIRAMIRNLPKMTRVGLIGPMSSANAVVLQKMNEQALVRGRMHPISMLMALKTYESGHSVRGDSSWTPVPQILDGLEEGFYNAFGAVEATNKRTMICLDVSGSMGPGEFRVSERYPGMRGYATGFGGVGGIPGLSARMASTAMAMVTARTEPNYCVTAFSHTLIPIDYVRKNSSIGDVMEKTSRIPFGATDCALPMRYALEKKIPIDIFQVYTDSETYGGTQHVCEALKQYRREMGINAKLVVNAMTSTELSIADPKDPGMLDCVGLDASTPNIIAEWSKW